ncbi:hypothetical protein ArsFIN_52670 (plasmid) [Arsenophonus nasoniae]|uniref:Uncharacterized protein n=1 Tax=Arsenophonus nasoniae TaxID=638 RepID=A0A4P7L2L7_9GAMM|nr:hypothetical protein ArsFIN_52670 [Arsenophonus nasoniae]
MAQVPQASTRSTDKLVHELTLSPYFFEEFIPTVINGEK